MMGRIARSWCACITLAGAAIAGSQGFQIVQILPLEYSDGRPYTIGKYYERGYQMATSERNEAGGINWGGNQVLLDDSNVKVLTYNPDTQNGGETLDAYLSGLNSTEDVYVLGGYSSSKIKHQVAAANKHGVVFVNGGGATSSMYATSTEDPANGKNDGRWAFGLLSPVSKLTETILNYMMTRMDSGDLAKPCGVALLWEESSHGESFRQVVAEYALMHPTYFEIGYATDFPYPIDLAAGENFVGLRNSLLEALAFNFVNAKSRALLVDAHSNEFVLMLNEMWDYNFGFDVVTFGARGTDGSDIVRLVEPQSAHNIMAAQWWSVSQKSSESRDWVRRWRIFEGFQWADDLAAAAVANDKTATFSLPDNQLIVEWYGALGFEAARIMYDALDRSSVETKDGVKAFIQTNSFPGSILPLDDASVRFGETGQAVYDFVLVQGKVTDSADSAKVDTLYPPKQANGEFALKTDWEVAMSACSKKDVGHHVSGCYETEDATRPIEYFWIDELGHRCEGNLPCACNLTSEFSLPKDEFIDCSFLPYDSTNGRAVIVIGTIGAVVCMSSLVTVLRHYNHVAMKAGQREFLTLMCFAGVWCNIAALSFLGPNKQNMCITRVIHLLLSVTLLVASLTVKVYRIYKIWNNSSMKRIIITMTDMFKMLGVLMLGIVIVLTVWMIWQTPVVVTKTTTLTRGGATFEVYEEKCEYYESLGFPVVSVGYVLMILLACTLLSFQGRNSDPKYMESRSIMFASYCITFILAIIIALVSTTDLDTSSEIVLIALSLVCCSILFVGTVVGPKVYFATKPEIKGAKRAIRRRLGSSKRTTENTAEILGDSEVVSTEKPGKTKAKGGLFGRLRRGSSPPSSFDDTASQSTGVGTPSPSPMLAAEQGDRSPFRNGCDSAGKAVALV